MISILRQLIFSRVIIFSLLAERVSKNRSEEEEKKGNGRQCKVSLGVGSNPPSPPGRESIEFRFPQVQEKKNRLSFF